DYVTKPFSVAELMARVEALLRRTAGAAQPPAEPFDLGAWRVDPGARSARSAVATVELTEREVALLALFWRERGRIVSRRRLLAEVWGMRHVEEIRTRTVDVHIAKLRKKLSVDGDDGIETMRGEGYRFSD
ncbi:MAG: response regulator transcription factor, partial [Candidatus Binatia bacterium]